jgi:DNA-binding NtrC family response regulator
MLSAPRINNWRSSSAVLVIPPRKRSVLKILLVEDDQTTAEMLLDFLVGLEHHDVYWAPNVKIGRYFLRTNDYDFGILDYNLPDGHGTDLLNDIGGNFEVVIFTALPSVVQNYGVPVFDKLHHEALLEYVDAVAARIDAGGTT